MTAAVELAGPPTILAGPAPGPAPEPAPEPAPVVTYVRPLPEIVDDGAELAVPTGWTRAQYVRALQLAQDEAAQLAHERARRAGALQIAAAGGALVLAAILAVRAAQAFNGFATLALVGQLALYAGAAGVVLQVWRVFSVSTGQMSGAYTTVTGHLHADKPGDIELHEGGHAVAARKLGGRVVSAWVSADRTRGLVRALIPNTPEAAVAFLRAGRRAAGTGAGCGADDAAVEAELRTLPREDRSRVFAAGDTKAGSIAFWHSGEIREVATTLRQKGSL